MKRAIIAGLFLLTNVVEPAMAQFSINSCANAGHGSNLPATGTPSITSVLAPGTGVYACYNNGTVRENNESLLAGNTFQDYKHGAPAPGNKDPTSVVGTYTIINGNAGGQITYHYTTGGTFAYLICSDTSHPPFYYFLRIPSLAVLNVQVTNAPGTC